MILEIDWPRTDHIDLCIDDRGIHATGQLNGKRIEHQLEVTVVADRFRYTVIIEPTKLVIVDG